MTELSRFNRFYDRHSSANHKHEVDVQSPKYVVAASIDLALKESAYRPQHEPSNAMSASAAVGRGIGYSSIS
jgi:hypothetical protein